MALVFADNFNTTAPLAVGTPKADNFNVGGAAAQVPSAPTNLVATAQDTGALLTWDASLPGSATMTGYLVTATSGGASLTYTVPLSKGTTVILASLVDTNTYSISVVGTSTAGSGPSSNVATVTPTTSDPIFSPADARVVTPNQSVPGAPTQGTPTASDATALIVWTPNADTGNTALTGYTIHAVSAVDGVVVNVNVPNGVSGVLGPLVNSQLYTVTVKAVNLLGSSVDSNSQTVTPAAGLPSIGEPPPDEVPAPPLLIAQPLIYAFPTQHLFRPSNFGLTPDQAEVAESA